MCTVLGLEKLGLIILILTQTANRHLGRSIAVRYASAGEINVRCVSFRFECDGFSVRYMVVA